MTVTSAGRFGMLPEMSSRWNYLAFLSVSLVLAPGCSSGTETGNPSFTGQLSYLGLSSAPSDIGVREAGSVATVTNAWFELDAVTVSSAGACDLEADDAFTVEALGVGDHAAGVHNFKTFESVAGTFCSVDVPFLRVAGDDTSAPSVLRDHAIVLTGELADGTAFTIESDLADVVRLQAPASGFALDTGKSDALLAFDFATWLKDVDFAGASLDAGAITLSEASNTELLRQFEANVAAGVALYRDDDGDGVLDGDPELLAEAP